MNLKKIIFTAVTVFAIFIGSNIAVSSEVHAQDIYIGSGDGSNVYITYESVVYGMKTNYYAKVRVKMSDDDGDLTFNEILSFSHDEGDWWFGIQGERGGHRVYDYEVATAVLNWLKAHRNEAHATANHTLIFD